jgi:alpha-tubulin suppressor-like RCC1 family protein
MLFVFLFSLVLLTAGGCEKKEMYYVEGSGGGGVFGDSDGDGISDADEVDLFGTSPHQQDTDGDGLSDYKEIVEYAFDPSNNPLKYNPLVADVPKLAVELTSPPSINLHLTETTGTSRTFETSRSDESASMVSASRTNQNSLSMEMSHTVGVDVGFAGWSPSMSVSYEMSLSMGMEATFSYTREQTRENRETLTRAEAFESISEIAASGGLLMTTIKIKNMGNLAFRIENLILSAVIPDESNPGVYHPIGNLILDAENYLSFPEVSIPPGGELGPINFIDNVIDLTTAKDILSDSRSMLIIPSIYELTDAAGQPFAFNQEEALAKTAMIVIDYAGYPPTEKHMVATNIDPENLGITAGFALQNCLYLPFTTGTITFGYENVTGLLSVRGIGTDAGNNAYWLVIHTSFDGLQSYSTPYDILVDDYDFENIELKAGHVLHLVYLEDVDSDKIYSREEFIRGSKDGGSLGLDSDGDTLLDNAEIINATDPGNPDTDYDGLRDDIDPDPNSLNYYAIAAASTADRDDGFFWNAGTRMALRKADGTLWMWGTTFCGACGIGGMLTSDPLDVVLGAVSVPTQVNESLIGWEDKWSPVIALGMNHSLALDTDGYLYSWGCGTSGELGIGNGSTINLPIKSGGDWDWAKLAAGRCQSFGIKTNGSLWAWGNNTNNTLGLGATGIEYYYVPALMGDLDNKWLDVASANDGTLAIRADGTLWAWGRNDGGKIGLGSSVSLSETPVQVGTRNDWAQIARGYGHSYTITTNGTLFSVGFNNCGELGIGENLGTIVYELTAVGTGWVQVAAGKGYGAGIKANGTLWTWGTNEYSQLGLGDVVPGPDRDIPTQVIVDKGAYPQALDNDWVCVKAAGFAAVGLKQDGSVWTWGWSLQGMLGNGLTGAPFFSLTPQKITSVIP